eukprot:IDg10370t1
MSTPARKRLIRDFKKLKNVSTLRAPRDPKTLATHVSHSFVPSDVHERHLRPEETPWEGGTFKLMLDFSEDYPNKPPQVKFVSKLFHPNVYNDGGICLDILQSNWSPIYDISAVLTSIQSLLCDPNPNSPANSEAARLFPGEPPRVQQTRPANRRGVVDFVNTHRRGPLSETAPPAWLVPVYERTCCFSSGGCIL